MGLLSKRPLKAPNRKLGIICGVASWGNGFATEAATACRGHALNTLGLGRVVSIISPENIPSQKVAEKVHDRMEVYQKRLQSSGRIVNRYLYISQAQ
ncbi:GNAT family N-acetyltransferase [Agrobacterium tumefaciens]|uniref:GNAT family N-acetyltransferase n=1 Tax=Agrobacterium tumefaciens TaxID=358 RepID=UPI003AF7016D